MADEKLHKLIDRLLLKSVNGDIKWSETTSEEAFQTSFPNFSVEVERAEQSIHFRIYNAEGKVLDWTSDSLLRREGKWNSNQESKKLEELFGIARRQALGVDKALEELLSVLG